MIEPNSKEQTLGAKDNFFRETPGPKPNIMRYNAKEFLVGVLRLRFYEPILRQTQHCYVVEARLVMAYEKLSFSTGKLEAFSSI